MIEKNTADQTGASAPATLFTAIAQANDHPAVRAPGRSVLTYAALHEQCQRTVEQLNHLGVGRNDRVSLVLPNGPEMATVFVAIGCGATTAPLNPAYRADEFRFYLEDVNAKALIVEEGSDSHSISVAEALGIPVVRVVPRRDEGAGAFDVVAPDAEPVAPEKAGMAQPTDEALVLHTSGTTSRPKIVPLTHTNLVTSGRNVARTLGLEPADCCMNIMPLFHIHGLIAAVLSSLTAGASVFCTPGFNALKVFSWMEEAAPTWYTAVPTMHQAIVARARRNRELIEQLRLRFIRSSSSSLPPQVMTELEDLFHCPVIEAYGMTEAAHQMASNPLPPQSRKAGTVGRAAGPEVRIMAEDRQLLPAGEVGEVVIRGANVTAGYENNEAANRENFVDGWFKTGDQGVMDSEGYLSITGRLKEIINRGGEKISPREVDEILMDHSAVQQVVTFAVPHPKLGEDVAAAVVLKDGAQTDESELREFAAERLADFKVPRKMVFLEEIPKGATGKLQRIGLADKLGLGG